MRYDPIPSALFSDRRRDFAKKMARGSIAIFWSNDAMPRNGDQFFPFRQDSVLFALSGLDQPGTILVLYPDAQKASEREIALLLAHDPEHTVWHGERYDAKQARMISGIPTIRTLDQWDQIMPRLIRSASSIYINPRQQEYPHHTFVNASPILTKMMMVKHPQELSLMKKAIQVTGLAFDHLLRQARPGMKEYEMEAELTYILSKHGCNHAFEPIVASGASACTLHYVRNDRVIGRDDLVLLDFGAEYAYMASDMTRTIPASGRFTKRQRAIYLSALNVLQEVTAMMRPGVTLAELNREAGKLIEQELVNLKVITKRDIRRQDPKAPLYRKYFMHGIGHHLGYDVHDLSERAAPLKSGMVLTCEPGLYIREEGIGIRLENDILITRGKPRNMMEHIPIDPAEIEEIMSSFRR
jgi:Xaa-Pro aminopeptidase